MLRILPQPLFGSAKCPDKGIRCKLHRINVMAKVKLDLQSKTDEQIRDFAAAHKSAILNNPVFPQPSPPEAEFDPILQAFSEKLAAVAAAETLLQTLRLERDSMRKSLETSLAARGGYVEKAAGGEEAGIVSAGFQIQSPRTSTTALAAPDRLSATMGDHSGEIDLTCHAVLRARAYIIEMREHSDLSAPGLWRQAKISARSSASITGLTPGQRYAFRIRALGPNDLESPWSAEVSCMAP